MIAIEARLSDLLVEPSSGFKNCMSTLHASGFIGGTTLNLDGRDHPRCTFVPLTHG